ncbi:hypothetical protein GCM10018790_76140 [Kitasatospora xanthocidica]|nr:hypothetical protein GCM10018790_76140 [Kitasatospora xanthocidica]
MGTLLQIIDALRDIITELDLDLVGAPRTAGRTVPRSPAERQRTEAVEYKAAAETEFDRVDHRRRVLELLGAWAGPLVGDRPRAGWVRGWRGCRWRGGSRGSGGWGGCGC